jgi:hypothetical protein
MPELAPVTMAILPLSDCFMGVFVGRRFAEGIQGENVRRSAFGVG